MKKRIRWGILGASRIAKNHVINAIQNSGNGSVVAVASRSLEKAKQFAEQFGIETIYGDYESLLNSDEVDAIYISVPSGLHYQWCRNAAEAGKPTLCEKPLCTQLSEITDLVEVFEKRKVLLAEASMYKYHPLTTRVTELITGGRIGDIKCIDTTFYVQLAPDDIRLQPGLGGGALLDLGYYCVGIMQYITNAQPQSVKACAKWLVGNEVDEVTAAVLQYPSGIIGTLNCGFMPAFEISYSVIGTLGKISVDEGGMVLWPGSDFKISIEDKLGHHDEIIPQANHYQLMVEDFADALLHSRSTRFNLTETISLISVLDRIRQSAS